MIDNKKLLAIIPARQGSKRLLNKNILSLSGLPLIAWTIQAANDSNYIDRVIVSTDSEEIASISKTYKAEVPFLRPDSLATDDAKSIDVIFHVLEELATKKEYYDFVILLQPTSPLRTSKHIDEAIILLQQTNGASIISVSKSLNSPFWTNELPKDKNMLNFINQDYLDVRSQDLPQTYCLNGAIYIAKVDELLKSKSLFMGKKTFAYIMKRSNSIDIDNDFDFKIASVFLQEQNLYQSI